jgi:hypothetical protein
VRYAITLGVLTVLLISSRRALPQQPRTTGAMEGTVVRAETGSLSPERASHLTCLRRGSLLLSHQGEAALLPLALAEPQQHPRRRLCLTGR